MHILKAAVVGAGAMGGEIAQVIASVGVPVVLKDIDAEMLASGLGRARSIFQRRVDRGKMSVAEMSTRLGLVAPTLTYDGFGGVDLAIEAVPENMAVKRAVFKDLCEACPERAILATNTSALSISELAASTRTPHRVVGMHFFNPAHVMKLVEVIPGPDTSRQTIDDVVTFAQRLRKLPVVVQECPGFLVNRLVMVYLNEAAKALEEGAATLCEIDAAIVGWGMPMGPFALMDMLGIDICCDVIEYLHSEYGDRMRPALLYRRLMEVGRFGEKAGAGFYDHPGGESEVVRDMIEAIRASGAVQGKTEFSVERLMYLLINEAAQCVQENVASVADIDRAMIAGTGMTLGGDRLGPLAIADRIGLEPVVNTLLRLEKTLGPRFRPARPLMLRMRAGHLGKSSGKGFHAYVYDGEPAG